MRQVTLLPQRGGAPRRRRLALPSSWFYAGTSCSALVLLALACWPALAAVLASAGGVDLERVLGVAPERAFRKTWATQAFWMATGLSLALYAASYRQRSWRGVRTLTLALTVLHNAATLAIGGELAAARRLTVQAASGDYFEQQWPNLGRLQILELPAIPQDLGTLRSDLLGAGVQSIGECHRWLASRFDERRQELRRAWAVEDDAELKALFFMNVVSGLWGYGNVRQPDRPGGVLCNEENGWVEPAQPTFRTYLESNIACCNDFALLLTALLVQEGLEARLTCVVGHSFTEAWLGGRWRLLDPTANFYLDQGWEDLYSPAGPAAGSVQVWVFPHAGVVDRSSPLYRPVAGQFRLLALTRLANRPAFLRHAEHPSLPFPFQ